MRRQSILLRQYGIWVKIGLGCLIFICLGGLNVITFIKEVSATSNFPNHNTKLEDWTRPSTNDGPEFEAWKERKRSVQREIDIIIARAKAKGDNYSLVDYFKDYDQLMDLEDRSHFYLTSSAVVGGYPIHELVMLRDAEGMSRKVNKNLSTAQVAFMDSVRTRSEHRAGEYLSKQPMPNSYSILMAIINWLWPKYLILAIFWILIYVIRFEERTRSQHKFKMHHHELGRFIDTEEPFPGKLSLKDELIICPWRFFIRVFLWPFYCLSYPHFENTAEGIHYVQGKARLLQNKPFGYQLSSAEDTWLRQQARQPVKEFEKTLKQLSEFEVPQLVKKSLVTAYLSLFFGILLQPAIVLAAAHSDRVAQHFYGGQVQLVQVQQNQHQLDGPDPPHPDHFQPDSLAILPSLIDLQLVYNLLIKISLALWVRLPILVFNIDHVPINSLV